MSTELERSGWFMVGWRRAVDYGKASVMLIRRRMWAFHRYERARRAADAPGPKCFYCDRPGHDEAEEACWRRALHAKVWMGRGEMWRGKEGE